MAYISNTQLSMWTSCPYTWQVNYIERRPTFIGNIYTVFGTSIHEIIQNYLDVYYNQTIKSADTINLNKDFINIFKNLFEEHKDKHGDEFTGTKQQFTEFTEDGINILNEFKKRKGAIFPKKNHELLGNEIKLNYEIFPNINFIGYLDTVIRNKKTGLVKIIDIKTATFGWNRYQKANKLRTNQLLLYKHFYGLQESIEKIEIEYLILKRKLWEKADFPQKRIQRFSPASGKPSMNKVLKMLDKFINECFDSNGEKINNNYQKCDKSKKCKDCKEIPPI